LKKLLISLLFITPVHADIITEFGMGYKLHSSAILEPWCKQTKISNPHSWPENPRGKSPKNPTGSAYSCGGDNPAFIGWPIAWETSGKHDVFYVRAGWFHFSHWGDGSKILKIGDRHETHMDLAAVVWGINWTNRRKKRKE